MLAMSVKMPWGPGLVATKLRAWTELFVQPNCPPAGPGVYAWYFDEVPPGVPTAKCVRQADWTLLYVGIAPKAPPSNGKPPSQATLRKRLRQHFGGVNASGSTLRLSLGCLLARNLGITLTAAGTSGRLTFLPEGERRLTDWMKTHARVCWVEHEQPWRLEHELLGKVDLPLNLDDNRDHPFHAELSRTRAEAKARARTVAAGSDAPR